ncbi:helix-turn-helix domain-containing protein [Streptococcus catagoni]|uniref:helix-turn-helix domain-containing protein n=1 Tax=Streptococcus catagoni TaxID=2654874 RepID=UPI001408E7BC|nr:helix-turn-helix transcriptional regulator [Streptococcus catagoni]
MKLGKQIIRYRHKHQLSQETLAEKIYVSRQSISNWENNKTYPDIHSLLLLCNIFQVSLDQLVKGDLKEMEKIVSADDKKNFDRDSLIMTSLMFLLMVVAFPLFYFLSWLGLGIFLLIWAVCMFYANRVEKFKKKYDIQTYKAILALEKGERLSSIETYEERAKYPYQKPLIVLAFTLIAALICFISSMVTIFLLNFFN